MNFAKKKSNTKKLGETSKPERCRETTSYEHDTMMRKKNIICESSSWSCFTRTTEKKNLKKMGIIVNFLYMCLFKKE